MSRFLFHLGSSPISCSAKRQSSIATPLVKTKYKAHFEGLKEVYVVSCFDVKTWFLKGYIHNQNNHSVQGPNVLKGLKFITFDTRLTYFDWGLL
jgi:hypothetical protein